MTDLDLSTLSDIEEMMSDDETSKHEIWDIQELLPFYADMWI